MSVWVKICGITNEDDARAALDAGADAIGVNLIPSSRRAVDVPTARRLRETVGTRAEVVAVVADLEPGALEELRERTGIRWLQLHGEETPALLTRVLPEAYKALRVAEPEDVDTSHAYGGSRLLVDAKVQGALGGTGHTFDWSLVTELARERALIVAGGLTPENVADAIRSVRPHGVDTASGVEDGDARRKNADKVARFVRAARSALLGLAAFGVLALAGCSQPSTRDLVAPDAPLPGVVAGLFETRHCKDASGAGLDFGPRYFVALAPPGVVGENLRAGTYPPGVITLLDQRVGYEGVLLSQGKREGTALVYRSPFDARDGRRLIEEVRVPVHLAGNGEVSLRDALPGPGGTVDDTPGRHRVILRCEVVAMVPGLDTAQAVDYEPERQARTRSESTHKTP